MSKIKEFLGLDKDFKTHTKKKNETVEVKTDVVVPPVEATVAIPAAEPVLADGDTDTSNENYAVAGAGADPHDKKLDHFQYTKDPNQLDYWEFGEDVNTMSVPKNIRDKYPGMRFHWRSMARIDRLGMDYKGWQKFVDPTLGYAEGLKRGNDTMLFAMPEERAQKYNDKVAAESTRRVIELQENQLDIAERASHLGGGSPYDPKGGGTSGIAIGERKRGQSRGISREEVVERITKQQEARSRGRVTFDMGRR